MGVCGSNPWWGSEPASRSAIQDGPGGSAVVGTAFHTVCGYLWRIPRISGRCLLRPLQVLLSCLCSAPVVLPLSAEALPTATALEVRLSGATGSRISHAGDPIEATIIAPVSVQGRIIVPQGSRLLGSVAEATAISLGLKHSTASIAYAFHTLQLPSGPAISVNTQLVEVETAKERVDGLGTVHGIHPVAGLSSGVSFYAVPLLLVDPTIGAPVLAIKTVVAHLQIQRYIFRRVPNSFFG